MSHRQISSANTRSRKQKKPEVKGQGGVVSIVPGSSAPRTMKAKSERSIKTEEGLNSNAGAAGKAKSEKSVLVAGSSSTFLLVPTIHEIHQMQFYDVDLVQRELTHYDDSFGVQDFVKQLKAMLFMERFCGKDNIVIASIDAKWTSKTPGKCVVSLLTIGIGNEVFIFDLMNMKSYPDHTPNPWLLLAEEFFWSRHILKIGYQISSLLRMISKCSVEWVNLENQTRMYLDVDKLGKQFAKKNPTFFPYSAGRAIVGYGLAELVRVCVGKPLSWMDLHSNWELRPLPSSLVDCSSIVAIALLDVFGVMITRAIEFNVDIESKLFNVLTPKMPKALPTVPTVPAPLPSVSEHQ